MYLRILIPIIFFMFLFSTPVLADIFSQPPDSAFEDDGTDVLSQVNVSDDVRAELDMSSLDKTDSIDANWTNNNIPENSTINSVIYYFEHYENQASRVDLKVYWYNGTQWIQVCSPSTASTDTISSCDLTSYITNVSQANNVFLRFEASRLSGGTQYAYVDYMNLTVNYTPPAIVFTNLSIWDDTDFYIKRVNETIGFYANYSNSSDPILNASCIIGFNISGGWEYYNMSYNLTSSLYEYYRSFSDNGTFNWNVTCSKTGYQTRTESDTFIVYPPAEPSVEVVESVYYACPSTVYYKIQRTGSTDYYIRILDNALQTKDYSGPFSYSTYYGNYTLGSEASLGNWTAKVEDAFFRVEVNKSFVVKARPESQPMTVISTDYYGIASSSDSEINVYTVGKVISCNITVNDRTGELKYSQSHLFDNVSTLTMSSLGGTGWQYPALIHVQCNDSAVVTSGPSTEGMYSFLTPSQLSSTYYGIIKQAGSVRISAPFGSLSYVVKTLDATGGVKQTISGTIPVNGSVEEEYAAASSIIIELNGTGIVVYEPDGTEALLYSSDSLSSKLAVPIYDKTGTSVIVFAVSGPAELNFTIYPQVGYIPTLGVCNVLKTLGSNQTEEYSISTILRECDKFKDFASNPLGTLVVSSNEKIVMAANPWSGSSIDQPAYKYGNFYLKGYFASSTSSLDYLLFIPSADTYVYVNGEDTNTTTVYSTYAGTVNTNYLNISSTKPIAVSVGYSGESTLVVVGE